jgi:hypothetical protein
MFAVFDRARYSYSVRHAEGGAVGPGAAAVVEPGGRRVGVAEPLLDLAEVGAAVQGVGGRRGPQGVRAETFSVNWGVTIIGPKTCAKESTRPCTESRETYFFVGDVHPVSGAPAG